MVLPSGRFVPTPCCSGQTDTAAEPKTTHMKCPRMDVAALQAMRLPDVRIVAVEHREQGLDDHVVQEERTFAGISGSGASGCHMSGCTESSGDRFISSCCCRMTGMGGGGGFVGRVINWARFTVNHGFVTMGTDTGHQSPSVMNGDWALNDVEAQLNFGYLAVHRTVEVAKAITRIYYDSKPDYSYFIGCSRGGGQALMEAQRYPDDFDGIVSAAPALNWSGFTAAALHSTQHLYPDPTNLNDPVLSRENLQ